MNIKLHTPNPPLELQSALDKVKLKYTDAVTIFHCLRLHGAKYFCGVFGDGDNGAYEWFIWDGAYLETSDVAYGMSEVALRDVLNKVTV